MRDEYLLCTSQNDTTPDLPYNTLNHTTPDLPYTTRNQTATDLFWDTRNKTNSKDCGSVSWTESDIASVLR